MTSLQILAQFGAERVLNSIPAGLLIAVFAWLLLRMLATKNPATGKSSDGDSEFQNSGTRFAIWFSSLMVVVALPFVPVPALTKSAVNVVHPQLVLSSFWAIAIASIWVLVATLSLVRVAAGLWKLRAMRRNAIAIPAADLDPALQATIAAFQSTRAVAVSISKDVRVPTAIGFFRPVILLPEWALRELSTDELKVILLHEFAHLRRRDDWTNLAQKLVRTVFFFHPAVWWIEKRLSLEREMACDDVVLAETRNPQAYAECLVSLAEKSFVRRGLAMAQAVISHAHETSLRLAQILDANRPQATRVSKPALGVVAALAVLSVTVLPDSPRLIAFENPGPVLTSATSAAITQASVVPPVLKNQTGANRAYAARNTTSFSNTSSSSNDQVAGIPSAGITSNVALQQKQSTRPAPWVVRAEARRSSGGGEMNPTSSGIMSEKIMSEKMMAQKDEIVPAPDFVLVMHTARFDGRDATVSFAVWRVTFATANGNTVQTVIVKQI